MIQYTKKNVPYLDIQKRPFEVGGIYSQLESLKIYKQNDCLITKFADTKICEKQLSKVYGIFDFPNVAKRVIPFIEEDFNPIYYDLLIKFGVQQLRIYGDELIINRDIFKKVFVFFSSTNGYYPLQIAVGFFRQVCSNGMIIPIGKQLFNIKIKHYYRSIEQHIAAFEERIPLMQETFEEQKFILESMANQPVSLKETVKKLVQKQGEENLPLLTIQKIVKRLGKKLLESESDKLNISSFEESQIEIIQNPTLLLKDSEMDVSLEKYKIFNCYLELFRNSNASVIERENRRIINVLTS